MPIIGPKRTFSGNHEMNLPKLNWDLVPAPNLAIEPNTPMMLLTPLAKPNKSACSWDMLEREEHDN